METMTDYIERVARVADDLTIFARDYPAQGRESGLPVACIPGLTRNSADFDEVAKRIAARGRRVIAIDNRGRGRSDWDPQPERYLFETYANDAMAMLDILDIPRAVFIGQSLGGVISAEIRFAAPDRVAGIVLNDVGPTPTLSGLERAAEYLKGVSNRYASWEELESLLAIGLAGVYPRWGPEDFRKLARAVACEYPDGRIGGAVDPAIEVTFNQSFLPDGSPIDLTGMMARLKSVPLLLIRGALSDLVDDAGIADVAGLDLDLAIVEVPDVGHCPTLDEPVAWRAIVSFLDRVP